MAPPVSFACKELPILSGGVSCMYNNQHVANRALVSVSPGLATWGEWPSSHCTMREACRLATFLRLRQREQRETLHPCLGQSRQWQQQWQQAAAHRMGSRPATVARGRQTAAAIM